MSHNEKNHISPFVDDAFESFIKKHPESKNWPAYKIREAQEIEELRQSQYQHCGFSASPPIFYHG